MLYEFNNDLKIIPLGLLAVELLWDPASIADPQCLKQFSAAIHF